MSEYKVLAEAVHLPVYTKRPEKWLLIDRETGQVYQGNEKGYWDRLEPYVKESE